MDSISPYLYGLNLAAFSFARASWRFIGERRAGTKPPFADDGERDGERR